MDGFLTYFQAHWPAILLSSLGFVVLVILYRHWAGIRTFISEVKVELQKASWPWDPKEKGMKRYKELTDSTVVVIIAMLLLGAYVSLFDFILVNVIQYFTRLH